MAVIGTFAWQSLTILRRIPLTDALVMILVTIVTVMSDLAIAVVVGVVVLALAYSWNTALRLHAMTSIEPNGTKIYQLEGPLFFGSVAGFARNFVPSEDPDKIIIEPSC